MYLSGILLAGGASSRFGTNKLKSKIGPLPLYINQLIKMLFFCDEVIISSNRQSSRYISRDLFNIKDYLEKTGLPPSLKDGCDIRLVNDEEVEGLSTSKKSIGPVLGLYNGLSNIRARSALVTAFDMPFISYELLSLLREEASCIGNKEAVIISREKGFESLCSIYSKRFLKRLEYNINRGEFKISLSYNISDIRTIEEKSLKGIGIDSLNFFNINRKEDLLEFNKIFYGEVKYNGSNSDNNRFIRQWKDYFYRKAYKATQTQ